MQLDLMTMQKYTKHHNITILTEVQQRFDMYIHSLSIFWPSRTHHT